MAGTKIRINFPGRVISENHNKLINRELPEQHPFESIYRSEDKKSLDELLKENLNRCIVFVMPDTVKGGIQDPIVRFPFDGEILGCFAFCLQSGSTETSIRIEKISESSYMQNGVWDNIFSQNLKIAPNKKFSDKDNPSYIIENSIVNKYDYFRIGITPGSGIKNLTVQLYIKI